MAATAYKDRILETSAFTGLGAVPLLGPVNGYGSFTRFAPSQSGLICLFEAVDVANAPTGEWEVASCTLSADKRTLTRDAVRDSSNAGAAVSFSAGTKRVHVVADGQTVEGLLPKTGGTITGNLDIIGTQFSITNSGGTGVLRFNPFSTTRWRIEAWDTGGTAKQLHFNGSGHNFEYNGTINVTIGQAAITYDAPAAGSWTINFRQATVQKAAMFWYAADNGLYFENNDPAANIIFRSGPVGSLLPILTLNQAGSTVNKGSLATPDGIKLDPSVSEKSFTATFTAMANEKVQLYWPGGAGGPRIQAMIEVTVSSAVYGGGFVRRIIGCDVHPNGNTGGYATKTEAEGPTNTTVSISDLRWDAANARWFINIANIGAVANTVGIHLRVVSVAPTAAATGVLLSAAATSDVTVIPAIPLGKTENALSVSGIVSTPGGRSHNRWQSEKTFELHFGSAASTKARLIWPVGARIQGMVEIIVSAGYNDANSSGYVKKTIGVYAHENGTLYNQNSNSEGAGNTPQFFTISDFAYDSSDTQWYVIIAGLAANAADLVVTVRTQCTAVASPQHDKMAATGITLRLPAVAGGTVAPIPTGFGSDGNLVLGTKTPAGSANPTQINLGALYSNTAGQNPKIRMFDDTTQYYGFGISDAQLDYMVPTTNASHNWYVATVRCMQTGVNRTTLTHSGANDMLVLNRTGGAGSAPYIDFRRDGASGMLVQMGGNGAGYIYHNQGGNLNIGILSASNLVVHGGGIQLPTIAGTAIAANVSIDGSNVIYKVTSSLRYKEDIQPLGQAYAQQFLKLNPISFRSKHAADDPTARFLGFIAEEADALGLRELVSYGYRDEDIEEVMDTCVEEETGAVTELGRQRKPKAGAKLVPEGFAYDRSVVLHHALLRELFGKVDALQAKVIELEGRLAQ